MREFLYIFSSVYLLTACSQNKSPTNNKQIQGTADRSALVDTINEGGKEPKLKRLTFRNVSEIVGDSSYSTWVKLNEDTASLALHFQYKDTLAVSYSSECWLMYPYKIDNEKIVVSWDKRIDTKYNFDIVKAINKTDKKLIGKPFMILELENDTTLKATYLLKGLIERINTSSKERTFFPDRFVIAQDGYL